MEATMAHVTTSIETARTASKLSGRGTGYNIATPSTPQPTQVPHQQAAGRLTNV